MDDFDCLLKLWRVQPLALSYYVDLIESGRPFSLARYGDGEFQCIMGDEGHNCDGHEYFPALRADLRKSLTAPRARNFLCGLVHVAHRADVRRVITWCANNKVGDVSWADATSFIEASRKGELLPLVAALRKRRILYVGPEHLRALSERGVFDYVAYVVVADHNCYLQKDETIRQVVDKAMDVHPDLIGFSAGLATNALIYDLHPTLGNGLTMVDFGALWDVYVGKPSRKWQEGDVRWEKLTRQNLGIPEPQEKMELEKDERIESTRDAARQIP